MTGRLFLHIGPPKTATTSLQVALESLTDPRFSYVGVFQPRVRNNDSLAQLLHEGLQDDDNNLLRSCVKGLEKLVTAGQIVFLSEEMLSLEQKALSTATKIERLGKLFSGIPTTVLITLRDPQEAIPSLYQELYRGLSLSHRLNFSRFCISGYTDCFDYQLLDEKLKESGLQDVRRLDFRSLTAGLLTTANIFGASDLWSDQLLDIKKLNSGQKSNDGKSRSLGSVTLREIGRWRLVSALIDNFGLRGARFTKKVANAFESVHVRKSKYRNLIVPTSRLIKLRSGYERCIGYTSEAPTADAVEKHSYY